jgi:hypothetical protein
VIDAEQLSVTLKPQGSTMTPIKIRKKLLTIETTYHEHGPAPARPLVQGSIAVVINNPFAGRYVEDLSLLVAAAKVVAGELVPELIDALGGADRIETYGKGAIVGVNGELEHGAIWHEAGGWEMRARLPKAKAVVPATKVVAACGTRIQIPLHSIEACYVRSHFNSMDVGMIDGPRPDELLYAVVMGTGGRIHERLGGLRIEGISVGDGQR